MHFDKKQSDLEYQRHICLFTVNTIYRQNMQNIVGFVWYGDTIWMNGISIYPDWLHCHCTNCMNNQDMHVK